MASLPSVAHTISGSVADRPWGGTLATIMRRQLSGQLTIGGFTITFVQGAITGATSPLPEESAPRLAVAAKLLPSSDLQDDVELVIAHAEFPAHHAAAFRRHVIGRRAARTFSLEDGDFTFEESPASAYAEAIDTRAVIYLGARTMITEARLDADLRRLGERFRLTDEGAADLPQFGAIDPAIVDKLRRGCAIGDVTTHAERAAVYALACTQTCVVETKRPPLTVTAAMRTGMPYSKRDSTAPETVRCATPPTGYPAQASRTPTPTPQRTPLQTSSPQRTTPAHGITVVTPPKRHATDRISVTATDRMTPPYGVPVRRPSPTPSIIRGNATDKLLGELGDRLARGTDGHALFGLSSEAPPEDLRRAYLEIVRLLRPSLGLGDDVQFVFMRVSAVFAKLSEPTRETPPQENIVADTAKEAYCRGELALGTGRHEVAIEELSIATELEPNRAEYLALLAWARFAASSDKAGVAEQTRRALTEATTKTANPVVPIFYLACVARALDRDREALRLFQRVLHLDPEHREARREVVTLVQRLEKKGLFRR